MRLRALLIGLALATGLAGGAHAADPPTTPALPGCWYTATPSTLTPNSSGYILCDAQHHLSISGSFSANTSAHSTAAAPTYVEGTDNPLSTDLTGALRITGTINASSAATATTADPSYTNGTSNPFSQDLSGHLRTLAIQSGTWTVTANAGSGTFAISAATLPLPTGASTSAKQPALGTAGTAASDVLTVQGIASMTALKVDGSTVTQPVSGTVTANAGSGTFAVSAASLPLPTGAATAAKQPALGTAGTASADVITVQGIASMTALKVDGSGVTQPVSGTVTANAGTNLNTSALETDATAAKLNNAQGSTTSGQTGPLVQCAVTTSAPSYTTAQTDPLSCNVAGAVRVDGSGVTQPVSGTVTANAGSGTFNIQSNASINEAQVAGTATDVNTGNASAGTQRVVLATNQPAYAVNLAATTTGGCTPAHTLSAATTNSTTIKGSAGTLCMLSAINTTATLYYLKLYDIAAAPTCNSSTVVGTFPVPASTSGAGAEIPLGPFGLAFANGIGFCLTGAIADNDNTAAATGVALSYASK